MNGDTDHSDAKRNLQTSGKHGLETLGIAVTIIQTDISDCTEIQ